MKTFLILTFVIGLCKLSIAQKIERNKEIVKDRLFYNAEGIFKYELIRQAAKRDKSVGIIHFDEKNLK